MDFANRGTRPVSAEGAAPAPAAGGSHKAPKMGVSKVQRIMLVVLLFAGTMLAVALIGLVVWGRTPSEAQYINKGKYQAVFLNGGQVYFGKIGKYNEKYLTLTDIFYLRVNQQVQPGETTASNDVSLAKLGSELHGPEDRMVINRSEVQFWENLKDDGQVVKAITTYKANPDAANQQTTNGTGTNTPTGNQQQTNTTPTTNTNPTTKKQ